MQSIDMKTTRSKPDRKENKSYLVCAITKIDCLAITVLFVAFLSGGFSLSRIDRRFRELGWLDNVAYWFLMPLLLLASMILYKNSVQYRKNPDGQKFPLNFRAFIFSAIMLHCYMAFSANWSPIQNMELSIDLFLVSLYLGLIPGYLRGEYKQKMIMVIEWTFWAGVIYAIGGVLSSDFGAQRMAVFGGGPNVFVRVVGGGLIAGVYLYLVKKRRLTIFFFPVLVIAAIASGSRGGVIGLMLTAMFMSMVVMPRYFRWHAMITSAVIICIVFWIGFNLIDTGKVAKIAKDRYYDRTFKTQYLSGRDRCFSDAIHIFQDNMLIGAGLDSFHLYSKSGIYPHNIILHIGAEGGVLGLALLSSCIFLLINRWFKPRREENDFLFILCMFYFISSLVSGGIYDGRFIWLYGTLYMLPPQKEYIR